MYARFAVLLLTTTNALGQSATSLPAAKLASLPAQSVISKRCSGLADRYKRLKNGNTNTSVSAWLRERARSEDCLQAVFSQLDPEQKATVENAFRLYQAADSELLQQVRAQDVAGAREQSVQQMKEGAYQLASVFVQFGELTYRYDQLLDDVDRYMKADEQFHKAMAASPPGAFPPPTPIPLPAKLDFLECSHYHVGRYSACWPADYDD